MVLEDRGRMEAEELRVPGDFARAILHFCRIANSSEMAPLVLTNNPLRALKRDHLNVALEKCLEHLLVRQSI